MISPRVHNNKQIRHSPEIVNPSDRLCCALNSSGKLETLRILWEKSISSFSTVYSELNVYYSFIFHWTGNAYFLFFQNSGKPRELGNESEKEMNALSIHFRFCKWARRNWVEKMHLLALTTHTHNTMQFMIMQWCIISLTIHEKYKYNRERNELNTIPPSRSQPLMENTYRKIVELGIEITKVWKWKCFNLSPWLVCVSKKGTLSGWDWRENCESIH